MIQKSPQKETVGHALGTVTECSTALVRFCSECCKESDDTLWSKSLRKRFCPTCAEVALVSMLDASKGGNVRGVTEDHRFEMVDELSRVRAALAPKREDLFRGDDGCLVECINALLELDDADALVPHGLGKGSHAYILLTAAATRLAARAAPLSTDPSPSSRDESFCDPSLNNSDEPTFSPGEALLDRYFPSLNQSSSKGGAA